MKSNADGLLEEVAKACENFLLVAIGAMSSSPTQAAETAGKLGLDKEEIQSARWVAVLKRDCQTLFGKDFLTVMEEIVKEKERKTMKTTEGTLQVKKTGAALMMEVLEWLSQPGILLRIHEDAEFKQEYMFMLIKLEMHCVVRADEDLGLSPDQLEELIMKVIAVCQIQGKWSSPMILNFLHQQVGREFIENFLKARGVISSSWTATVAILTASATESWNGNQKKHVAS